MVASGRTVDGIPDRGGLTVMSELRDTNERGDSLRLPRQRRAKIEGLSGVTGSSGKEVAGAVWAMARVPETAECMRSRRVG